jgi:hypothetical protein
MKTRYTRKQAVELFGSRKDMAAALGTTTAAISMLPKTGYLQTKKSDEIVGASIRLGLVKVQEVES